MRTQMLGRLSLDEARLSDDLVRSRELAYAEQYPEFQCGHRPWQTCMLWSGGGEVGDGIITHYDTSRPSRPTILAERVPYVRRLVEEHFATEHLVFCRMVVMSDNVLVPHRDFLEFAERPAGPSPTHRLHVPLATGEDCLFIEDNVVYRMLPGEVWALDVTRIHSAGVLSDTRRVHLILDFADVPEAAVLRFTPDRDAGIPDGNVVARPALSARERDSILGLSGVVDLENLPDVLGMVIKKQFRRDGGDNYVWATMEQIGRLSGDEAVHARIRELHRYFTLERDD